MASMKIQTTRQHQGRAGICGACEALHQGQRIKTCYTPVKDMQRLIHRWPWLCVWLFGEGKAYWKWVTWKQLWGGLVMLIFSCFVQWPCTFCIYFFLRGWHAHRYSGPWNEHAAPRQFYRFGLCTRKLWTQFYLELQTTSSKCLFLWHDSKLLHEKWVFHQNIHFTLVVWGSMVILTCSPNDSKPVRGTADEWVKGSRDDTRCLTGCLDGLR